MSLPNLPPDWFQPLLRCPDCGGTVVPSGTGFACRVCEFHSPTNRNFHPQRATCVQLRFQRSMRGPAEDALRAIDLSAPAMAFAGPAAVRDSRELMSEIAARLPAGGDALDLGCGPRDQSAALEYLGFRYVGLDYSTPAADLLGDAHAIPFADGSFDCVFSYAVLEHLHNPFIAFSEVARVLRPGGWFIGTVSQGEPFHSSYFHHTPWALLALVQQNPGLRLHRLWPSMDTLASLATMGRYSRVLKALVACADFLNTRLPWLTPRKARWPAIDRKLDQLYRAGSICFSVEKVGPPPIEGVN